MGTYEIIAAISIVIIISYLFNVIAKKTNIPSVLMLIVLGIVIQLFLSNKTEITDSIDFQNLLALLGKVGLILIVLEAALDLEVKREKMGVMIKALLIALLTLFASTAGIAALFHLVVFPHSTIFQCIVYAVPLSIMSSAIIIPSVGSLSEKKKEFMVYESSFSDILGIMLFNYLIKYQDATQWQDVLSGISVNLLLTLLVSTVAGVGLVWLFQKLTSQAKLFLIISVLLLLYVLGHLLHIPSLVIILVFGLILNNNKRVFKGKLTSFVNPEKLSPVMHDFHTLTLESAFVTRTFFFVIFGITIELASLVSAKVAINSLAIVGILLVVRWVFLKMILFKDIVPELYIAPRGLITILLFYAIPNGMIDGHYDITKDMTIAEFDQGILLYVILISSLIMAVALIKHKGGKITDAIKETLTLSANPQLPDVNTDASENETETGSEN